MLVLYFYSNTYIMLLSLFLFFSLIFFFSFHCFNFFFFVNLLLCSCLCLYKSARVGKRPSHYAGMVSLLDELKNHNSSWPFQKPVDPEEVPDYYTVITNPMGEY